MIWKRIQLTVHRFQISDFPIEIGTFIDEFVTGSFIYLVFNKSLMLFPYTSHFLKSFRIVKSVDVPKETKEIENISESDVA